MVKFGVAVALTVRARVVVAVRLPEVPVMVTVELPVVAVELAVRVRMLLPVVGFVPKAAVTPLGRPEAARVTLPENPPASATGRETTPEPHWGIVTGDEGPIVKLPAPVTVSATDVDAVSVPEVPVTVIG